MKKILFIAPHLSTGGLPQVLVNKIELLKDNYIIKCVEWSWHGDAFVVQKNRIKDLIGPENLFVLGEDKNKIFDLIHGFQPDIVCLEEFCEHFIPEEINEKLFIKERTYKLFETTHDSSIPVTNKRWFPDKFIFVSPFNAFRYSMFDVPYEIIEYPIDIVKPDKQWAQEQLMLDPEWKHVVIVGLFTERKNQGYVFEIAKQLKNEKILFHFIGNQADNFRHYWEPLMKDQPDNCVVWGERSDVETFLQASDLFLFPSKGDRNNKELNPIAIKEAIKYELPIMMFNLDVYCGKYNNDKNIKFITGDINKDIQILLNNLGISNLGNMFDVSWDGSENKIILNYGYSEKINLNITIRCMTSNAPLYWFNLNIIEPLSYFIIPIPIHVMKFEGMENFRGFRIEFYNLNNELLGSKELVVNDVKPNIPSFNFKPFDCNYVNYHEFFIDRCFSGLGIDNLDTVIDIGANVGLFAKYMYSVNAKKVILVEANPYLKDSIETLLGEDNKRSVIYMKPIYGEKTTIPFRFSMENTTIGSNYFGTDHDNYSQLTNVIDCETITLDEILKDNNYERISLLKCDIEGGEYPLFESVTDEQIQLVDRFMIEFHGNQNGEIKPIIEKLKRNNYEYEIIVFVLNKQTRADENVEHGVIFAKPKNLRSKKPKEKEKQLNINKVKNRLNEDYNKNIKTITIIDCFVDNDSLLSKLRNAISNLKRHDHKILLVSNKVPPQDLIEQVDYFLYNSENKLFKEQYENVSYVDLWKLYDGFTIHEITPELQRHGLSVLSNLFNCLDLAKSLGFTHFQRIEVDDLYSEKGYEYMKTVPKLCEEKNKKSLFYLNEGKDVSFHYFYSEINFFLESFPRINSEESYKQFLQNNGFGNSFKPVEFYLYHNIKNKGLDDVLFKNGEYEMNYDFDETIWNTETSQSTLHEKYEGCSTKIYKVSESNNLAVISYNYNNYGVQRKIIVTLNEMENTIIHQLDYFNAWVYNIYDESLVKISVYDNETDRLLYELENKDIKDYIEFK
jgi:FkbM family methyltransferase